MLTNEQQETINKIKKKACSLLKIEAVSGAGKTFLLQEITKQLKPSHGLYIAYNKAIA